MNCEIRDEGGVAIVQLSGEIDLESSPKVRLALLDCVGSKAGVLVDMSAVTYIDSSGVASLEGRGVSDRTQETVADDTRFGLAEVSESALGRRRRQRYAAAVFEEMMEVGIRAIPIVSVLAGTVGIMLAIQGIHTLKIFGAESRVTVGIAFSVVREFAPLITGILVAGRSGSALAARLGTMNINQEIDALRVMGINPVRFLVAPPLFAMLVMLPLLTFWADVIGLLGAGLYVSVELVLARLCRPVHRLARQSVGSTGGHPTVAAIIITWTEGCRLLTTATGRQALRSPRLLVIRRSPNTLLRHILVPAASRSAVSRASAGPPPCSSRASTRAALRGAPPAPAGTPCRGLRRDDGGRHPWQGSHSHGHRRGSAKQRQRAGPEPNRLGARRHRWHHAGDSGDSHAQDFRRGISGDGRHRVLGSARVAQIKQGGLLRH